MEQQKVRVKELYIIRRNNPEQWAVRFHCGGGVRIERRLRDTKGVIVPTPGVRSIREEKPEISARAYTEAGKIANRLGDEAAFSTRCKWTFAEAMGRFLEWHEKMRNNPQLKSHARRSVERFGDERIQCITRQDVSKWIDEMALTLSHYSVRNHVAAARGMVNWLTKQERWSGSNVFEGYEWRAQGAGHSVKPIISALEFELALRLSENHPGLIQAMMLGYYSGLRPSEVYRVGAGDFNHRDLILTVRVKKTGDFSRLVAIPQCLSVWASERGIEPLNANTVQHGMMALQGQHPSLSGFSMATFRKNFAAIMEAEGVSHETIDAHQGRYQSSVLKKHYLRDKMRAVKLMKPYMKVFGSAAVLQVATGGEQVAKSISSRQVATAAR